MIIYQNRVGNRDSLWDLTKPLVLCDWMRGTGALGGKSVDKGAGIWTVETGDMQRSLYGATYSGTGTDRCLLETSLADCVLNASHVIRGPTWSVYADVALLFNYIDADNHWRIQITPPPSNTHRLVRVVAAAETTWDLFTEVIESASHNNIGVSIQGDVLDIACCGVDFILSDPARAHKTATRHGIMTRRAGDSYWHQFSVYRHA